MYRDPFDAESTAARPSTAPNALGIANQPRRQLIAEKLYREQHVDGPRASAASAASQRGGIGGGPAMRPQLLMCYLCGQQFGTNSLHIHQPQCHVKKLLQWERGPVATRGPKPLSPEEFAARAAALDSPLTAGGSTGGGRGFNAAVEDFNNMQYQAFTELSLVPCENCGRTFLPDRLVVHLRSCKPGSTARRVASPAKASSRSREPPSAPAVAATTAPTAAATDSSPTSRLSVELGPSTRAGASSGPEDLPASAAARAGADPTTTSNNSRAQPTAPRVPLAAANSATAQLVRCRYCSRTFAPNRIDVHENVCLEKNAPPPPPVDRRVPKPSTPNTSFVQPPRTVSPQHGRAQGVSASPARPTAVSRPQTAASAARASVQQQQPVPRTSQPVHNTSFNRAPAARRSASPTLDSIRNSLDEMTRELAREEARSTPSRPHSRLTSVSPPPSHVRAERSQSPLDPQSTRKPTTASSAVAPPTPIRPMVLPVSSSATSSRSESPAVPVFASLPVAQQQPQGLQPSATPRPKFCGECGTSVLTATAKFCVECGSRL